MPFAAFTRLSPNFASEPLHEQSGVLIHHSSLGFEETISRMLDPSSQVSYHCIISANGTRCTLVPDHLIAWHAGASHFQGRSRCNDFLLGLAFAGNTYETPLSEAQIESALEWLAQRWTNRGWTPANVIDHRQVSPARKDDLNPIEWARFINLLKVRFASLDY
jgi:N-acetyl-anhydromuramyl-L-alanine amidase AmpD